MCSLCRVPRDLRTSRVLPPRLLCPPPPPSAGMQGLMAPRPSWKPVETPGPTDCWLSRQHISSLPLRDRHSLSRERIPVVLEAACCHLREPCCYFQHSQQLAQQILGCVLKELLRLLQGGQLISARCAHQTLC